MKRYASETRVENGYYLNTTSWTLKAIDGDGGVLPGAPGTTSIRLMTPVMIVGALVLSFLFVVFLPTIGLALFAYAVAGFLARSLARVALALTHALAPQWRPGEAWLTRVAHPETKKSPELDTLRREVETRRTDEDKR